MKKTKPLDPEDLKKFPRRPGYKIGLSDKEEAFCREYMRNGGKSSKAAVAAGFVGATGSDLLTRKDIKSRIRTLQAQAAERNDISVNWVVTKYKEVVEKGIEINDLRAANGALEGLGKYLGMFQKEEHTTEIKVMGFFTHDDKGDVLRLARAAGFQLEERANPPQEAKIIEAEVAETGTGTTQETA